MSGVKCSTSTTICGSAPPVAGVFAAGATAPCCEIQQCHDAPTTSPGDTIEVHAGTYQHTGSNVTLSFAYTGNIPAAARLTKAGGTLINAGGEAPVIDLQNTREMGIWVDADGWTIDGMRFINILTGVTTNSDHRVGCITAVRNSGAGVSNTTIRSNACTISSSTSGLSGSVCYRLELGGTSAVYSNTCSGTFGTGFLTMNRPSGGFIDYHHNTLSGARPANSMTCFIFEHYDSTATVHHNSCVTTGIAGANAADRAFYPRDNNGTLYFYDNYAWSGASGDPYGAFYFQDDDDLQTESVWVFNNTMEGYSVCFQWRSRSFRAHVRNNLCNAAKLINYDNGGSGTGGGVGSAGDTSDVSRNVYRTTFTTNDGSEPEAPATNGANILNAAGCSLLGNHHLQSTSTACIDAGYNNPIGTGANACSVSGISCRLDIDNEIRPLPVGGAWDIGYDEYNSGGGPTQTCGNGVVEGTEICDDGNTTTETACSYGTPTCTKCNSTCTASLSLTGGFCGDALVADSEVCDGANLNGHSCVTEGFASGTLTCSACLSFNTSGCVAPGTLVLQSLSGATLKGGTIH